MSNDTHTAPLGPIVNPDGEHNGFIICKGSDPLHPGEILFCLRAPLGTSRPTSDEDLNRWGREIVRAVNSHTDLLKALEGIEPMFDNDNPLLEVYKNEVAAARAAITRTKGASHE